MLNMIIGIKRDKKMKIKICVLSGDNKINAFAQATDIFHPSKAYATHTIFTAQAQEGYDAQKVVDGFVDATKKSGQRVVAVFIVGRPETAYVDHNVISVSDGKKWYLLKNFLQLNGIGVSERLEAA